MISNMKLPGGWVTLDDHEVSMAEQALKYELCEDHQLCSRKLKAVARRTGTENDEILFIEEGSTLSLYTVRLTWWQQLTPELPEFRKYSDLDEFLNAA